MNHHNVLLLSIVFQIFQPVFLARAQRRKAFRLDYYENCKDRVYPWTTANFSLLRNDNGIVLSGEQIVTRDIRDPVSVQMRMEKCKDRLNPNSCEHLANLKWPDYCSTLRLVPIMRMVNHSTRPPFSCPVKKNHYYINNAEMPLDVVTSLFAQGAGNQFIKFQMLMSEKNQPVFCANAGLKVAEVKTRS